MMDLKNLNQEGQVLWNKKAAFWDNLHGEFGNRFHQDLVSPSVEALLAPQPGQQVLDIACGSGQMSRRLAALGCDVTAIDFSEELINFSKKRGTPHGNPIQYRVMDATDEISLLSLGERQFDHLVCTMAFMDIPDLNPLFRAAKKLLKPSGSFVFATAHPAFFSNNPGFLSEKNEVDGQTVYTHALKITNYLSLPPMKGVGAPNEPVPHIYYHRPLHELLGFAFQNGFVLDALLEPGFDPPKPEDAQPLHWTTLWQMPPVLAGRFKITQP
jgi:2-polyprenyl-3-methyl-5-hydroxy-6-metoxy-1,4-benzoquinol methylase